MANLTIELSSQAYEELKSRANLLGKSPQQLAQELVVDQLDQAPAEFLTERERGRRALLDAGLLTELGPELQKRANSQVISLEEAQGIMGGAGGSSLSEIVIEQREQSI